MEATKPSLIGPSLLIKGHVKAKHQPISVQGRIEGTLELDDALIIEDGGAVDASLTCREASIAGELNGQVYATEKLSIESSGRVSGALFAPVFSVAEGARLDGSVDMDSDPQALEQKFQAATGKAQAVKPAKKAPKKAAPAAKTASSETSGEQSATDVSEQTGKSGA